MLFLIDAKHLAYRAHHGFSKEPLLTSKGENVGAVCGVASAMLRLRSDPDLTAWAFAWEGPEMKHRHVVHPGYKSDRRPTPDDLRAQFKWILALAEALRCPIVQADGYEADDVMASLAARTKAPVALVTYDKDLLQVVDDRVRLLKIKGREDEYEWIGPAEVREKWGVDPAQTRDVLALMGDSTDCVPGVPGIGEKIAAKLVAEHGTIECLYGELVHGTVAIRKGLVDALLGAYDQVVISRELVTVNADLDLAPQLTAEPPNWHEVGIILERLELASRLRRYLPERAAA